VRNVVFFTNMVPGDETMNIQATTKTRLLTACVALGLFATANPLAAQSTLTAGAAAKTISFEVGEIVTNPKTTTYSQQALINHTAGQPSVKAYNNFEGNVKAYHKAVRNGRNGKVMEAVFAHSENSRFAATGSGNRILVTAAEGMPAHAADLVLVNKNGRVLNQSQSKTGWNNARKALLDPKYKGMSILTDQDSLNTIRRELLKVEKTVARRGLPLPKEWKVVKDGLKSGRLLSRTPTGAPLHTLAHVEKQSVQALKKAWQVTAKQVAAATASGTSRAVATVARVNPRVAPLVLLPGPRQPLPPWYGPLPRPGQPLPPWYGPLPGPRQPFPPVVGKPTITPQEAKEFLEKLGKRTRSLGKNLVPRGLVPLFLGFEGLHRYQNGAQIEKDFEAGTINQQQREVGHGENAGGAVGGIAASFGLAVAGAKGGAAAGSVGGPIGAGIGGVAGGLAGGIGGYFGGEHAGKKAAGYLVEKVHAAGTTVADAAKATAKGVATAAVATKNGAVYAAKATAKGVTTAAVATKNGAVYAAKATKNGVVNAASATGNFFKRGWEKFGW
jgi:hypothetical protein